MSIPPYEIQEAPVRISATGQFELCAPKGNDATKAACLADVTVELEMEGTEPEDWKIVGIKVGGQELVKGLLHWRQVSIDLDNNYGDQITEHVREHLADHLDAAADDASRED